jgi:mannosyltransferase OCH1-like enzyme
MSKSVIPEEELRVINARNLQISELSLHQLWMSGIDKTPKIYDPFRKSWIEAHKEFYYRVWDLITIENFIKVWYTRWHYTFKLLKHPIQKLYFGKYLILFHFGGLMVDMVCYTQTSNFEGHGMCLW